MTHKDGLSEPEAVKFLRETLTKRATSAEFNEWQARDIVAYIDDLVRRRTPANERGEPVAWRITFGDGSTWLRLTKAEVEEALASTNYDQVEVAPLYASPPSSPVAPEGVRVSYAKIIEIVNDCSERMKRSGESHRMLAKWVSEGINAALTPAAEQGETDWRDLPRAASIVARLREIMQKGMDREQGYQTDKEIYGQMHMQVLQLLSCDPPPVLPQQPNPVLGSKTEGEVE
jgi:hypothetical protein